MKTGHNSKLYALKLSISKNGSWVFESFHGLAKDILKCGIKQKKLHKVNSKRKLPNIEVYTLLTFLKLMIRRHLN